MNDYTEIAGIPAIAGKLASVVIFFHHQNLLSMLLPDNEVRQAYYF